MFDRLAGALVASHAVVFRGGSCYPPPPKIDCVEG